MDPAFMPALILCLMTPRLWLTLRTRSEWMPLVIFVTTNFLEDASDELALLSWSDLVALGLDMPDTSVPALETLNISVPALEIELGQLTVSRSLSAAPSGVNRHDHKIFDGTE
eukprot:812285_1